MIEKALDGILDVAAALAVPVPDAYRAGVVANFELLLEQAALVMAWPVADLPGDAADFIP